MKLYPWLNLTQIIEFKRVFIKEKTMLNVLINDLKFKKNNKHSNLIDLEKICIHGFIIQEETQCFKNYVDIFRPNVIRVKFVNVSCEVVLNTLKQITVYKDAIAEIDMCMCKNISLKIMNQLCEFINQCTNLDILGVSIGTFTMNMLQKLIVNIPVSVNQMFVSDLPHNNTHLELLIDQIKVRHLKYYRILPDESLSRKIVNVMKKTGMFIDGNIHSSEFSKYHHIIMLNKSNELRVIILLLSKIKLFKHYPELAISFCKFL